MTETHNVAIKRYELWIAAIALIGVLVTSLIPVFKDEKAPIVIKDTKDIREAIKKPFEGVWQYQMSFTKFHGLDLEYQSTGTAVFNWIEETQSYEIFIGYSIHPKWAEEKFVAAFTRGSMRANSAGWPSQSFEMSMRYEERVGRAGTFIDIDGNSHEYNFKGTGSKDYNYEQCEFKVSEFTGEAVKIEANFNGIKNRQTMETVTLGKAIFATL